MAKYIQEYTTASTHEAGIQNSNTKFPNTSRIIADGSIVFTKTKPLTEVYSINVSVRRGGFNGLNSYPLCSYFFTVNEEIVIKVYDDSNNLMYEGAGIVDFVSSTSISFTSPDSNNSVVGMSIQIDENRETTGASGYINSSTYNGVVEIEIWK